MEINHMYLRLLSLMFLLTLCSCGKVGVLHPPEKEDVPYAREYPSDD